MLMSRISHDNRWLKVFDMKIFFDNSNPKLLMLETWLYYAWEHTVLHTNTLPFWEGRDESMRTFFLPLDFVLTT